MKKYPHTSFDLKSIQYGGFELIEIKKGWLEKRNVLDIPHRHNFHEIIWITKGKDIHSVDFKDYCLNERDVLFIPRGSIHSFKPLEGTCGWKLIFDDSFFNIPQQLMLQNFYVFIPFLGNKAIKIQKEDEQILIHSLEVLTRLKSNKQKQTLMINLISFLNDYFEHSLLKIDGNYINFLRLLNKEIYNYREVNYYSKKLNISSKSLNGLVKEVTGRTILEFIHVRLINEAKSKLLNTQLSVSEIAYSIGFNDAHYFSRFFKKKTNSSPESFRNKVSEMSIR